MSISISAIERLSKESFVHIAWHAWMESGAGQVSCETGIHTIFYTDFN